MYQYISDHLSIDTPTSLSNRREDKLSDAKQDKALNLDEGLAVAAFVGKSLSDENRLRILLSLNGGKKTVSSIVEEMKLSQPLVSHHLKELRRCLLVKVERKGLFVYYEIADERILDIVRQLAHLATELLSKRDTF
jgi:ArsR family transcriptional regulator, zinc-responsive transcriptional repressor